MEILFHKVIFPVNWKTSTNLLEYSMILFGSVVPAFSCDVSTGCTEIRNYAKECRAWMEIIEWCYRKSQASAFCPGVLATVICSKTRNVLKNWVENKLPEYFPKALFTSFSLFRKQFVCWSLCQGGSSDSAQCTSVLFLRDGTFKRRKASLYFGFANKTVSQVWLGRWCSVAGAVSYLGLDVSVGVACYPETHSVTARLLWLSVRAEACGTS